MNSFFKSALTPESLMVNNEDIIKFFLEFLGESDRSAVILGTAKLDQMLCNLLTSFLLPNISSADELFDGDGPLSSFHSRILLAHRLGLIDIYFVRALHLIRRIRNSFAHETSGGTLDTHKDRIRELRMLFKYDELYDRFKTLCLKEQKDKGTSTDFRCALIMMETRLEGAIAHISQITDYMPWTLDAPKTESQKIEAGGPAGPADSPREK